MGNKIFVEPLDQTMYMAECSSDQQMHCYMEFQGFIDEKLLKKSIDQTLRIEKILHYCIDRHFFNIYWKELPEEVLGKIFTVKRTGADAEREVLKFIAEKIDICSDALIRVCLIRKENDDILIFKAHHIVTDATGFLNYISKVIFIYNQLQKNEAYEHPEYRTYHRSIQPIKDRYTAKAMKQIMRESKKVKLNEKVPAFPWCKKPDDGIYFVKHEISRENLERVVQYCRDKGFTLNDYLCAVYYKTYYSFRNELLNIETMYHPFFLTLDLRNYCRPKNNNSLHNYSTGLLLQYYIDVNSDIETIIRKMRELTQELKIDINRFSEKEIPGLSTVFALEKALKFMPFELMMKGCYLFREAVGCVPAFGNAGDLELIVDQWNSIKVRKSYLTGGIGMCMGAFGIASSCFYSQCVMSMNFRGNQENLNYIKAFFERYDRNCGDLFKTENHTTVEKL